MKSVLSKAFLGFVQYLGGQRSIKTVKAFNRNMGLYRYRLENYKSFVNLEMLTQIASLPCPTTEGFLDSTNIKLSKMLRNTLNVPEEPVCDKCPFKSSCVQAGVTSKVKPTVADFTRFVYARACNPPTEVPDKEALEKILEAFPNFIKNLDKFPVALKKVEIKEDEPISATPKPKFPVKKKPKIPKNCEWKPKPDDILKQEKLERRRERQKLETEIDLMIKRTTIKIKRQRHKPKRKSVKK